MYNFFCWLVGWLVDWPFGLLAGWLAVQSTKLEVESLSTYLEKQVNWSPTSLTIVPKRPLGRVLGDLGGVLGSSWLAILAQGYFGSNPFKGSHALGPPGPVHP